MSLLIPGTNSIKDTGYEVANSCRFNDDSDDHLDRTPSSGGNRRTWTWSCWFKRSSFTSNSRVFTAHTDNSNRVEIGIHNETVNCFRVELLSSSSNAELQTTALFRDNSAWFHAVVAVDTTQGTASNRVKIYINGTQVTSFRSSSYPDQNTEYEVNHTVEHNIGKSVNFSRPYDGYMCEVVLIDGQQLDATSFGEFNSDSPTIWQPINVSGLTFGTNGFYLDFEDSSALGNDVSGNNNDYTVNNLTSIDQTTDTCTNNFKTLNRLSSDTGVELSEGNTESDFDASVGNAKGNIGLTQGRWYWEVKLTNAAVQYPMVGIASMNEAQMQKMTSGSYPGGFSNSYGVYGNGNVYANGSNTGSQSFTYGTGDIIGVYLDLESSTKTIKWYKNGSAMATFDITNAGDDYPFACMDYNGGEGAVNVNYNFGNPAYSISSGNSDDNGYGNFEYSPNISSTKYYAVCTKNLAEFG
tara:strand:+ start:719 stop:2119 length:1401 start_codon:yes stop_codon:yes gene_type:complete